MAVVSMMRVQGDPEEVSGRLQNVREVGKRLAPKHGGLATITAKTDDGLLVINLWQTEEGRHAMAEEPEIQEAVRNAGLQPAFEGHEVLYYEIRPEAVTS